MSEVSVRDEKTENGLSSAPSGNLDDSSRNTHENVGDSEQEEYRTSSPVADMDNGAANAGLEGEEDDTEVIIQNESAGKLTFAAKQVPGARYNRIERIHLPTGTRSSDPGFERSVFEELEIPIPDDIALPHPEAITVFDVPLNSYRSRPWDAPGADINEYFNYGLNSATWDRYRNRQRRVRKELTGILDARIANAEANDRYRQPKGLETPSAPEMLSDSTDSAGIKRARPDSFPAPPSVDNKPPAFPMPPPILAASGSGGGGSGPVLPFPPPIRPPGIVQPGVGVPGMSNLPLLQPAGQTPQMFNATSFPPIQFPNPPGMIPPVLHNQGMQAPYGFPPMNQVMNPLMQPNPTSGFQPHRR